MKVYKDAEGGSGGFRMAMASGGGNGILVMIGLNTEVPKRLVKYMSQAN